MRPLAEHHGPDALTRPPATLFPLGRAGRCEEGNGLVSLPIVLVKPVVFSKESRYLTTFPGRRLFRQPDQGRVRGAEAAVPPPPGFHRPPRRPAPGPPPDLRPHLEYVSQPPDPGVRDPEVRRRLGRANFFVPLEKSACSRKIQIIIDSFNSQSQKQWFDEETFLAILRLRGMEANSPTRYAEAFYCRKAVLG